MDVSVGILGVDFLAHHKISVDPETCLDMHKPLRSNSHCQLSSCRRLLCLGFDSISAVTVIYTY